jgi:hypothetical protein
MFSGVRLVLYDTVEACIIEYYRNCYWSLILNLSSDLERLLINALVVPRQLH